MIKVIMILIFFLFLLGGCANLSQDYIIPSTDCQEEYTLIHEGNTIINNQENAYEELKDYVYKIESEVPANKQPLYAHSIYVKFESNKIITTDIEPRQIKLQNQKESIYGWSIYQSMAIDEEGNLYERISCI